MSESPSRRHDAMQSTLLLRSVIESAPTALVMIEREGRIVLVNAEAEKMFGYSRDELIDRPVELLVPERFCGWHPRLRDGFFASPEARPMGAGRDLFGLRKDGSEFPVEIGLNPIATEQGLLVLSAIVDITERKRLEGALLELNQQLEERVEQRTAELQEARDAAQAANRAKSQFLANMSHEIRTPLNAVIGLTEVVLRTQLTENQTDHLLTVMDSAESLLTVINDVLDFSKVEAGKLDLEHVRFNIHDSISDTLRSLALRAQPKGIELACFIAPELPRILIGDPGRLRQVLSNLVSNAIKFTHRGEVVLRVELEASHGTLLLHFSIRDTGIGIEPAQLDRLFDPFEQVDSSTTRRYGGSGLGLSICRQLVELMGGQLGAESTPGEGSTFHFTAEFGVPDESPEASYGDPAALEGARVLIVDDNATNRAILEEVTRSERMRPAVAASADEGHALLLRALEAGDPFRLILSDVHMPGVDGFTWAERIRADAGIDALEIILLTSAVQPGELERCEELRVAARLMKPINQSELCMVMARALGNNPLRVTSQVAPQSAARSAGARRLEERREIHGPAQRVLLVEDSFANRKVALAILDERCHTTVVAENGREALRRLATHDFDVVLMDVQMPEMDGFEATRAIRAGEAGTGRHLPIIAMTAHALQGDREKCLAAGMDDYVAKPVRREDLFRALARAVGADEKRAALRIEKSGAASGPALPARPAGVDWSGPLTQVGGNREVLCDIVAAYLSEIDENLERLPGLVASSAAIEVRRRAHTLKGAMRMFGATTAQQLAQELELLAETPALANGAPLFQRLRHAVEQVLPELVRFVESGGRSE